MKQPWLIGIFSLRLLLSACLLFPAFSFAQKSKISGIVYDARTRSPLAFSSVACGKTGTTTDIDGRFSIAVSSDTAELLLTHVGYHAKRQIIKNKSASLVIFLEPSDAGLDNVTITPGENPAHRIIRLLQQHKKKHDPKYIASYEYNAYTVAALGSGDYFWKLNNARMEPGKPPKKNQPSIASSEKEKRDAVLLQRFKQHYLFLTESYTKKISRYPDQSKETILATKVTGLRSPSFAMTATNFQPFGFYDDYLQLGDKAYVNPIINGSIGMYRFTLLDTRADEKDTVFVIRFQPKRAANFNGLKGTLYIHSDGYAIENVSASPADEKGLLLRYQLQQKYEHINGQWFPSQLNSTITQIDSKTDSAILYWDSRSYISNAVFNKQFKNSDFSDVETEFERTAGKRTEQEWNQYRTDSLREKEKKTYQTYTLLPPKLLNAFEKGNRFVEIAALQALTIGKVDIPLKYFLAGFNKYESVRFGGGFQTNEYLDTTFSFGGFAGYGVKDRAWKYGGNILLTLDKRTATTAQFSYSQDIIEPGNTDYFRRNGSVFSTQTLRNFYTSRMDSVEQFRFDLSTKIRPALQVSFWMLQEDRNPAKYDWRYENSTTGISYRRFKNTEAGIGLRWVKGEKFTMLGRAKLLSKPARTEMMIQLSKGLDNLLKGELDYTKLVIQFNHSFRSKKLGLTSFQVEAGQIWGDVPYAYLFNTKANNTGASVSFFIPNSFQTVGLYEFSGDRSVNLFVQHNFGSLLLKPQNPHIRPEFVLVQAIHFGSVNNPAFQKGIEFKTATKGLFESGLLVDNIYRVKSQFFYYGLGAGVFYRYGAYTLPRTINNFDFKVSLKLSF
jgi:Family of unknown function (DUF5686)/CarboxypepD_reg-like domain